MQVFAKDKIKLNILQEVISGKASIAFQLDNGAPLDYLSKIHEEGKRVTVLGKFNISEDANNMDMLAIRPIMIDSQLKIIINLKGNYTDKKISVIRNTTKASDQEYKINDSLAEIELIPQDKQYYLMKIAAGVELASAMSQHYSQPPVRDSRKSEGHNPIGHSSPDQSPRPLADGANSNRSLSGTDERFEEFLPQHRTNEGDNRFESFSIDEAPVVIDRSPRSFNDAPINAEKRDFDFPSREARTLQSSNGEKDLQRIEQEISVIERQQNQLSQKKQSAIDHLEKIEAEYEKDYKSFERELDEYKSRMEADVSIIEHYKDQDVIPVEIIFQEVRQKLDEAEAQIRFFIEARQQKTMEIENEIKSNKKQ